MSVVRYITHPEVVVDLQKPADAWALSERGRARAALLLQQPWLANVARIVSSNELKAIETAMILAEHLRIEFEVRADLGENDRSATGPLPKDEFERLADQFFAAPDERVRGWESAREAQQRIVERLADVLETKSSGDTIVVGHGAVGTLWYCHLAGVGIDRRHDQPSQGHYFSVDPTSGKPLHGWVPIDELVR